MGIHIASPNVTVQEVATELLRMGDEQAHLGEKLDGHIADQTHDLTRLEEKVDRVWGELRHYVPVWVAAVLSVLGTMFGAASGVAWYANAQISNLTTLLHAFGGE